MDRLSFFVIFAIFFWVAVSARLNDGVREVHFKKLSNESEEYEFEYDLDNGDTFRGQTYAVDSYIYFIFGAENEIYWAGIDSNEHKDEKFTKIVRKVERDGDSITFKDDDNTYYMSLDGHITVNPYLTGWDLQNVCFTKAADNQTFNFTVSSTNNSRKYNGTTYRETDDPKIQRFEVTWGGGGGVYEMQFTDIELLSDKAFCRGYDKLILPYPAILATSESEGMWVNQSLLKTLVG